MATKVFPLRATEGERQKWGRCAELAGESFNAWARRELNESTNTALAEVEEREARVAEQARVRQATAGGSCDHVAPGAFCYQCGRKRW